MTENAARRKFFPDEFLSIWPGNSSGKNFRGARHFLSGWA